MKTYNDFLQESGEKKWQEKWEAEKTFEVTEDASKEKFFGLIEFPYPSGAGLHVGHPRPMTAMDVISRKKRMEGKNVLYPIGFDAFGLPTENYAIKTGRQPKDVTKENIANFIRQLKMLGYSFDWSRVIDTTDPAYYQWTQDIFLKFFEHGLAYKKNTPINWCLSCKIGLANEEIVNGACERCGGTVEKRDKEQWMLAITKYADKLLEGLDTVDYIERAKIQQSNWIGKSTGAELDFAIKNFEEKIRVFTTRPDTLFGASYMVLSPEHALLEMLKDNIENLDEVAAYQKQAGLKSDLERTELQKDKTGVELKGIKAINPVNGEEIPVWIADYVLATYGTGAIMAVPAHDERDFEFAKKFDLPIRQVVAEMIPSAEKDIPKEGKETVRRQNVIVLVKHPEEDAYFCLDWTKQGWTSFVIGGKENGETWEDAAIREMKEETGYQNIKSINLLGFETHTNFFAAHKDVNRYGEQRAVYIELADDERAEVDPKEVKNHDGKWVKVEDLHDFINLDNHIYYYNIFKEGEKAFTGEGIAINSDFLNDLKKEEAIEKMIAWLEEKGIGEKKDNFRLRDWVFSRQRYWGEPIPLVYCPHCAENGERKSKGEERNPGWIPLDRKDLPLELPHVEKYEPTDNGDSPLADMREFVETTCPRCGGEAKRETDTMPNWAGSSWYWLRYMDPHNDTAFASKEALNYWGQVDWYNGGMEHTVLHLLYSRFWNQFLHDIGEVPHSEPYAKRTSHGLILAQDGEKMSKSKGNVVNPDDMVAKFGADALRTYIMFMGPFDQHVAWSEEGLKGVKKFFDRVWNLQEFICSEQAYLFSEDVEREIHKTIKKVGDDIEVLGFNTAIARMMEMVNFVYKKKALAKEQFGKILSILSPFAPHMTEELWEKSGYEGSISIAPWPVYDEKYLVEDMVTLVVQVNGKVRAKLEVAADISEEDVKALALAEENVVKWVEGKDVRKVIYVKGKLVSVVV
ncbi:class I tRNA ligase family protein [Patescibacteria group bacterium]|nr:class I tRNA ligase family protein [Patescibacteria group bacterium]MBU1721933.1 class I tRNA ligase family protein [Patescibacteria group bacterium]